MFQNRRTVFVFVCSIVFVQALYYIVVMQLRKDQTNIVIAPAIAVHNDSSDTPVQSVRQIPANTTVTTTTTTTLTTTTTTTTTIEVVSGNKSQNTSSLNVTIQAIVNVTTTTTTTSTTTTTTTTPAPIPFQNASFDSSFNVNRANVSLPMCNFSISDNDTSIYKVATSQTLFSYQTIEQHHVVDLYPGGHSIPAACRSEQRLALIICYRNREQHLKMFLDNIHPFLKKQQLDYTIFIVNQHGTGQFNRAALFNVGYLEAMKLYPFDCFIFHDVDLLPEDLRNVYKCGTQPRHMSVGVDKFNYKLLYSTLFGGVTAFSLSDFIGANGYPTVYWGWGGEDDDMYLRVVQKLKKQITRYPIEIARYKMIRTHDHTSGQANPHRHTILYSKYDYSLDGINTTNYTLNGVIFYRLFTLVNVTLQEEPFESIRQRLRIKKK